MRPSRSPTPLPPVALLYLSEVVQRHAQQPMAKGLRSPAPSALVVAGETLLLEAQLEECRATIQKGVYEMTLDANLREGRPTLVPAAIDVDGYAAAYCLRCEAVAERLVSTLGRKRTADHWCRSLSPPATANAHVGAKAWNPNASRCGTATLARQRRSWHRS